MKQRSSIPGEGTAIDGISPVKGRQLMRYRNWPALKRMFLEDPDYTQANTWLHEKMGWTVNEVKAGNTQKKIVGWGRLKAELEQKKTDLMIKQHMQAQAKTKPQLIQAKLALVQKIIGSIDKWHSLLPADKKLIYEILKTELGEPTKITNVGIGPVVKDPVEALLEDYGLMKDGRIIIDAEPNPAGIIPQPAESAGDNQSAAAPGGGSPAEIS